jgi:ribosomal protein S12 methylthiotransferase accessory factor
MSNLLAGLAGALRQAGCPVPVFDAASALPQPPPTGVVLLTEWTVAETAELSARAWRSAVRWIPVRLDGGLALVGPPLGPSAIACLSCAERARLSVLGNKVPTTADLRLGGLVPPAALHTLAAAVRAMLLSPDRYDGVVLAFRTDHATLTTHRVRPYPQGCEVCSPLPADTSHGARIRLDPAPATDPCTLRGANPRSGRE